MSLSCRDRRETGVGVSAWDGEETAFPPAHIHTLKCHKTNRAEREMHYLNFHHYFSPWLPLFLLIYFLVCFPQAVLFACIFFLSFLSLVLFGGTRSCPAFFRLPRLSSHGRNEAAEQHQAGQDVARTWQGQQGTCRHNLLLFPSIPAEQGLGDSSVLLSLGLVWDWCRRGASLPCHANLSRARGWQPTEGAGCLETMPELIPEPVWPLYTDHGQRGLGCFQPVLCREGADSSRDCSAESQNHGRV